MKNVFLGLLVNPILLVVKKRAIAVSRLAFFYIHYCFLSLVVSGATMTNADEYPLQDAIRTAQANDPWLQGSLYQQQSLKAQSLSAGTLPDPRVSLGFANIPLDSFDLSQEPMTQISLGISQQFPRGDSHLLEREKWSQLSQAEPYARADRQAMVAVSVAHLWLDAYRSEQSIRLIERDRGLFEHLVDLAESSYTTASGKSRQQDFIRAQLELTRLEDRLTQLHQMRDKQIAQLNEWLNNAISLSSFQKDIKTIVQRPPLLLASDDQQSISYYLSHHPKIQVIEQKINAGETEVKLAKQNYKPQWGVNAGYGYRDQDPLGRERADFFSVSVNVDVPLFTGNRQDQQLVSANARREMIKTQRALALRQLKSGFDVACANYQRLIERQALYKNRLLKEISEQAEASLTAYTHDDGDFAEVVRARIAQLNARIDDLNIAIDIQKAVAQINYFLVADHQSATKAELDIQVSGHQQ